MAWSPTRWASRSARRGRRAPSRSASRMTVTIRVLDEDGKPTVAKPLTSDIKSDEKDAPGIMIFRPAQIELNRPGKFKVELTAKDNVSDKTTKEVLDLTVVEVK